MGIRLLVLLQPFVVDAFILAVLAEAAPVAMLVIVLHHLLKIFLCLHIHKIKSEAKVLTYLNIALRPNGGLLMECKHPVEIHIKGSISIKKEEWFITNLLFQLK